ncbi:hypothetical protein GQX74_008540 [Glossina fuscipes]|nr:hypothetical protein GQX74_008540 [Glossina fuscipes]
MTGTSKVRAASQHDFSLATSPTRQMRILTGFIHAMGGGIRKDIMNVGLIHLISIHSGGDKYECAKTFGLTVVRPAWVYAAWEQRDQLEFRADTEEFSNKYNLKCFEGQKICFVGFPTDEHKLMLEMLETNGGVHVELGDPECSHIVVGQHATPMKPELKSNRTHILISDWFWYTIKNGYAIEKNYLLDDSASRSSASPAPSPPGDFPLPAPVFANFAADLPLGVSLSPPAIFTVLSAIVVFEDLSFGRIFI